MQTFKFLVECSLFSLVLFFCVTLASVGGY